MNWNFQNSYTQLPNVYYSITKPQDFENPRLILFNSDLANELNLNVNSNEEEICDFLLGKKNKKKNFFFSGICWSSIWSLYYFRRWKSAYVRRTYK